MEKTEDNTLTFRLPEPWNGQLIKLAEASGKSKHHFAKSLVLLALQMKAKSEEELDVESLEEAFKLIRADLADLRVSLGRGIGAILQDVAPQRNREEIRKWVLERIVNSPERKSPDGSAAP